MADTAVFEASNENLDTGRRRKRGYEDEGDEEEDRVSYDINVPETNIRRGAKQCRRVSGVMRDIKSLHDIGNHALVMSKIFERMTTKEVMELAHVNSMWCIVACRAYRMRNGGGAGSFLRLWTSRDDNKYLWMNWDFHCHQELLTGTDESNNMMEEPNNRSVVKHVDAIRAIFTVANRHAFSQITDEDAKLPFRQEFVYVICEEAIITAPNMSFTSTADVQFEHYTMAVESLFIPKSSHFTMKAFSLEVSKQNWPRDIIASKLEILPEDSGENQSLKAMIFFKYNSFDPDNEFLTNVKQNYPNISFVGGVPEDLGTNRIAPYEVANAVGYSIYADSHANVSVFAIDFQKSGWENVFSEMKRQVESKRNGFCIIIYNDSRPWEPKPKRILSPNEEEDWGFDTTPLQKATPEVLEKFRHYLPNIQLVGFHSLCPIDMYNTACSNVDTEPGNLTSGFLLVTY